MPLLPPDREDSAQIRQSSKTVNLAGIRQSRPDSGLGFRNSTSLAERFSSLRLVLSFLPPDREDASPFEEIGSRILLEGTYTEIGISLAKNQRQHRTLHIQKDVLPCALCWSLCLVSAALASIFSCPPFFLDRADASPFDEIGSRILLDGT